MLVRAALVRAALVRSGDWDVRVGDAEEPGVDCGGVGRLAVNHVTLELVWANGESDWHTNAKVAAKERLTAPRTCASGDDSRLSPPSSAAARFTRA